MNHVSWDVAARSRHTKIFSLSKTYFRLSHSKHKIINLHFNFNSTAKWHRNCEIIAVSCFISHTEFFMTWNSKASKVEANFHFPCAPIIFFAKKITKNRKIIQSMDENEKQKSEEEDKHSNTMQVCRWFCNFFLAARSGKVKRRWKSKSLSFVFSFHWTWTFQRSFLVFNAHF